MALRMKLIVPVMVLSAMGAAMAGCGARTVDRERMHAAARASVVSVVMSPVADVSQEGNRAVLQAAVNRAFEQAQKDLAEVHSWTVVDLRRERKAKTLSAFGKVSDADMAFLFPDAEARKQVQGAVREELSVWKGGLVGAEGLLAVPRAAFAPGGNGPEGEPAVRQVMLQQAGRLCAELDVDAIIFVQVRAQITRPRPEAFIVTDNRTDGMLSMAQTLVVVDKSGRVIVDMGWPSLGKDARSRDLLPLYRGAGRAAVRDGNIDLSDPKGKVPHAFTALVDETARDLMTELRKAAGK
jgi:hypothetical protein